MNEWQYYFDDQWFLWLWHNYSILLGIILALITGILKIIAIRNPNVPCDEIKDLIKVIFTKPGNLMASRMAKKK